MTAVHKIVKNRGTELFLMHYITGLIYKLIILKVLVISSQMRRGKSSQVYTIHLDSYETNLEVLTDMMLRYKIYFFDMQVQNFSEFSIL